MFDLRYYQNELCAGAREQWRGVQSTSIIAATGTGKTECYLHLAVEDPGRTLVLVHRDYLISQPVARLAAVGFRDVAVEKAERSSDEGGMYRAKIVFASVSSIGPKRQARRLERFRPEDFSQVFIDEGHRGTAATYRRVADHFRRNPKVKILVLTATPNRKDGVALRNICDSVAGVYGPSRAMAEGWIAPVRFFRREVRSLDFSHVRMRGADLDPQQVQEALLKEEPLHEVCASLAEDAGPTIVFCPEVAIAQAYATLMNERYRPGRAACLHHQSDDADRERASKSLAQGEMDYIFQVNLFTEGYDLPGLLRVVWAAPTASLVRYTQGVGRVFRPHASLRGRLTGGVEQSSRRRLLIEQSPKPFGIVVTYYPQNCRHELCDPVDVLGGDDLPEGVKAAAKQLQEETAKSGGSKTEDDIETARIFCDLRTVLDERLKEVKAKAEFTDRPFDPMSGRKQSAGSASTQTAHDAADAVTASWGSGDPATEKQCGWLRWKGAPADVTAKCTKWRASVVRDLFEMGVSLPEALGWGKRKALKVRDEMRARREAKAEEVPS